MKKQIPVREILLGMVLAVFGTAVFAEDGWKGEFNQGFQTNIQPTSQIKFQEFVPRPDGPVLDGSLGYEGSNLLLNLGWVDQGGANREAKLSLEVEKNFSAEVNFSQNPHLYSNDARTIYTETLPSLWVVPDPLQMANQGLSASSTVVYNNVSAFSNNYSMPVTVKLQDSTLGAKTRFQVNPEVEILVDVTQKWRSGYRPLGTGLSNTSTNIVQLPEHLDQTTTQADVSAEYAGKNFAFRGGYNLSLFDNRLPWMIWDNPVNYFDYATTTTTPSRLGRYGTAPDNMANRFSFSAETDVIPNVRLAGDIAYGIWSQNQPFLPYTINSGVTVGAAPSAAVPPPLDATKTGSLPDYSLNGVENIFTQNYVATARPFDNLVVSARFRDQELLNNTPNLTFPGFVVLDQSWKGITITNSHLGYVDQRVEANARWQPVKQIALSGGGGLNWMNHTGREVEASREDIAKAGAELSPLEGVKFNGDYVWSHRVASKSEYLGDYWDPIAGRYAELPGLRRLDVGDRLRQDLTVKGTLTPLKTLFFSCAWTSGKDNFEPGTEDLTGGVVGNINQQYGLTNDDHDYLTFSSHWEPIDGLELNGYVDQQIFNDTIVDNSTGNQAVRQIEANNRVYNTSETCTALAFDGSYAITDSFSVNGGWTLTWSNGINDVVDSASVTAVTDVPNTQYRMEDYSLGITYKINDTWSVRGTYLVEFYDEQDFATDGLQNVEKVPATGAYTGLFLGIQNKPYIAQLMGISVMARL